MTKIAGSGYISQRHGSADPDPDPPQKVMDQQHSFAGRTHLGGSESCLCRDSCVWLDVCSCCWCCWRPAQLLLVSRNRFWSGGRERPSSVWWDSPTAPGKPVRLEILDLRGSIGARRSWYTGHCHVTDVKHRICLLCYQKRNSVQFCLWSRLWFENGSWSGQQESFTFYKF